MFAKVFGQIFDSSIAEDYNCRRMFMDLLVLADSDGVVDMTLEAISRRTNVPLDEVTRYIHELQQPDCRSRSQLEEGKRLVKISSERDWGWQIVNYQHYKRIKDEEARRAYFRDAQRRRRERLKKQNNRRVKDPVLTPLNVFEQVWTNSTNGGEGVGGEGVASASSSVSNELQECFKEWLKIRMSMGKKPKDWVKMFSAQLKWLRQFPVPTQVEILNQSIRNNWQGLFEVKQQSLNLTNGHKPMSAFEIRERIKAIDERLGQTQWDKDNPKIAEERKKLLARKKELQALLRE